MAIVFVGIDLAKNVFAVHAVDEHGKPTLVRPSVARAKLHELIASLPPCTVAMEACSGGHHWARLFAGHLVDVHEIGMKPAERFASGSARHAHRAPRATRPSVEKQSVPR